MRVSAKADYAVRALVELAAAGPGPVKGERLADAQAISRKYLENLLLQLKAAGLVRTLRGNEGGYMLARPADQISLADVIRAIDGPLANVRGQPPEQVVYPGAAGSLRDVWIAVRANLRAVLDVVTLGDVARGQLPPSVCALVADPSAWQRR